MIADSNNGNNKFYNVFQFVNCSNSIEKSEVQSILMFIYVN